MPNLNVLIVGASIAGPMASYWFAKAGAKVTVIERWPSLRPGGQNVDIRTTGVSVMRKVPGMEAAVKAKLYEIDGFSIVREDGSSFATIKATGNPDQQSIVSEYEILRGDLSQILFDLTKNNERVNYIFDEQIASIQQKDDDGQVTVSFVNGTPTAEYDLVVACDGATSRTRALGLGCGVRDHIETMNAWSAYCSVPQDLLNGSKMGQARSAVGGRTIMLGPGPSGRTKVIFTQVYPRAKLDATLPFRKASKQGTDALKTYAAQQLVGAGWKSDEIIKGLLETDEFYASEMLKVRVPQLHKGRFVLVGDAGFAAGPTGTGTSLALTSAYALAGEVRRHKDDLAVGLLAYEERMGPIIKDMQKTPPGFPALMAPQTAWAIWLRDTVIMAICYGMAYGNTFPFSWFGKLFARWSSAFGSDTYELPDYEWVV